MLYLADRGYHVALKLTLDGQPLLELGNRGRPSDTGCTEDEGSVLPAGEPFNRPTRLSPSPSGDLYVSDGYRNSRVHRFSGQGPLLASWGEPGNDVPGQLHSPPQYKSYPTVMVEQARASAQATEQAIAAGNIWDHSTG